MKFMKSFCFLLIINTKQLQAVLAKYTSYFVLPMFQVLNQMFPLMEIAPLSTPSSWDLLFCVAQHSEPISMTDWSFICIIIMFSMSSSPEGRLHVLFILVKSKPLCAYVVASKKSTKISWINKWNRKYCCLQTNTILKWCPSLCYFALILSLTMFFLLLFLFKSSSELGTHHEAFRRITCHFT